MASWKMPELDLPQKTPRLLFPPNRTLNRHRLVAGVHEPVRAVIFVIGHV